MKLIYEIRPPRERHTTRLIQLDSFPSGGIRIRTPPHIAYWNAFHWNRSGERSEFTASVRQRPRFFAYLQTSPRAAFCTRMWGGCKFFESCRLNAVPKRTAHAPAGGYPVAALFVLFIMRAFWGAGKRFGRKFSAGPKSGERPPPAHTRSHRPYRRAGGGGYREVPYGSRRRSSQGIDEIR